MYCHVEGTGREERQDNFYSDYMSNFVASDRGRFTLTPSLVGSDSLRISL